MNEYTPDLYTLVDEDGNEQTFEMLDVMEVDDQRYFALIPYQADPESMIEAQYLYSTAFCSNIFLFCSLSVFKSLCIKEKTGLSKSKFLVVS